LFDILSPVAARRTPPSKVFDIDVQKFTAWCPLCCRDSRGVRRARVGSVLLAGTLVMVFVASLWAVPAVDLNEAAGWANILALPVAALGLVLVLADHARARAQRILGGAQRAVLTGHADMVSGCAFSTDGELLATVSRDGAYLLDYQPA
jgi:hypothetical protein